MRAQQKLQYIVSTLEDQASIPIDQLLSKLHFALEGTEFQRGPESALQPISSRKQSRLLGTEPSALLQATAAGVQAQHVQAPRGTEHQALHLC